MVEGGINGDRREVGEEERDGRPFMEESYGGGRH